jgi:putative Mn2+ efflux pump MntP
MVESTLRVWPDQYIRKLIPAAFRMYWHAGTGAPMSFISNSLIAFSMSTDAFAAAIGKGVTMRKPRLLEAARIGAIFGLVETITPIAGWMIGLAASTYITTIDHWIAFSILCLVGGRMIFQSFQKEPVERSETHTFSVLIVTAIGTSIDAMAVGATMAFIDINIWTVAGMIGVATFIMATIGIMAGHQIGRNAGRLAETLGGVCLIAIGTSILIQHLGGWA